MHKWANYLWIILLLRLINVLIIYDFMKEKKLSEGLAHAFILLLFLWYFKLFSLFLSFSFTSLTVFHTWFLPCAVALWPIYYYAHDLLTDWFMNILLYLKWFWVHISESYSHYLSIFYPSFTVTLKTTE